MGRRLVSATETTLARRRFLAGYFYARCRVDNRVLDQVISWAPDIGGGARSMKCPKRHGSIP